MLESSNELDPRQPGAEQLARRRRIAANWKMLCRIYLRPSRSTTYFIVPAQLVFISFLANDTLRACVSLSVLHSASRLCVHI